MIKPPCGFNCPRRSATCHSKECPEWVEYERKHRAELEEISECRAKDRLIRDVAFKHFKPANKNTKNAKRMGRQ